ncbi:MAG: protein yraN [Pelosinus sp.]|jgi:putative endonuclease|nr:protein yraN [Pelosinus sp.]
MVARCFIVNTIKVGDIGEQAAVDYLHTAGYDILERKYRSKIGEIDIIAQIKDALVFVEVKTRRNTTYGFPAESVTYCKQKKIINTALCYLQQMHNINTQCRFDVIEIFLRDNGEIKYNHIMNAFIK